MAEQFNQDGLAKRMLRAIYQETGGAGNQTAGMWAIGEKLGLDRGRTEDIAMQLVADGLVEIKSLSGGLSLTEEGRAGIQDLSVEKSAAPDPASWISRIESEISRIESEMQEWAIDDPTARHDLEIDIATLKLQIERSRPLNLVILNILEAIQEILASIGPPPPSLVDLLANPPDGTG